MALVKLKKLEPINYINPIATKILQRRHQILVHSCLYYDFDESIVSDEQWNIWARELVQLQTDNPEVARKVRYAEEFEDFDATTGYHLPYRIDAIRKTAMHLLKIRKSITKEDDIIVTKETNNSPSIGQTGSQTSKTTRRSLLRK